MAQSWIWIATEVALAAHAEQLAEHGGGANWEDGGVRDAGALESATMRPRNPALHEEPDAAALAAVYAFGIGYGDSALNWPACRPRPFSL